jgi:hypothetical protein
MKHRKLSGVLCTSGAKKMYPNGRALAGGLISAKYFGL